MPTRLTLQGLTELKTALRHIPEELVGEGDAIVASHADDAQRRIQTAYPEGPTGNLKRGVRVERNKSKFHSAALVKSSAKHSALFNFGTKRRTTRSGANRGQMPKASEAEAMIPIVVRVRAQMVRSLIGLVERAGFTVGGK